jgi:YfiH family protein
MPFNQVGQIRYFYFESLRNFGVVHGIFTRRGGLSTAPWASLNVGATVGDDKDTVKKNRYRAFTALGLPFESAFDVWQVHSNRIVCIDRPKNMHHLHFRADGILTNTPGVSLFMRFADCVPVLLFDPQKRVIGVVHAGWVGTISNIVGSAIESMANIYQSKPDLIIASIGPSIGVHHYEVGQDVIKQVYKIFGNRSEELLINKNGAVQFDLWKANELLLKESGVNDIEIAGICTACNLQDWFSHRGEKGNTGRFGALIAL